MAANDNDENVVMLMSMGFDADQSRQALKECNGNVELAINSLLSSGGIGDVSCSSNQDTSTASQHQHQSSASGHPNISSMVEVASQQRYEGHNVQAVHCSVSQYNEPGGRSACTSIALTMASKVLRSINNQNNVNPTSTITTSFLSESIYEGIQVYMTLDSTSQRDVEHSSVEELLRAGSLLNEGSSTAKDIFSSLNQLDGSSPKQGISSNTSNNPMGLEAVLSQCQTLHTGYIAVVITKPPETILVILPSLSDSSSSSISSHNYILLDSHPRPRQLLPHYPSGSYALFHPNLNSLVSSIKQIFPVTELGSDVPEMMAMMYNSFDAYAFKLRE